MSDPLDTMARTVWGEARGEGERGMEAIAWVIKNRAKAMLVGAMTSNLSAVKQSNFLAGTLAMPTTQMRWSG